MTCFTFKLTIYIILAYLLLCFTLFILCPRVNVCPGSALFKFWVSNIYLHIYSGENNYLNP